MKKIIFLNISNHPSSKWSKKQLDAAKKLLANEGKILDYPIPNIPPEMTSKDVYAIVNSFGEEVYEYLRDKEGYWEDSIIFHVMGEQTFCFSFIRNLMLHGFKVVASTTDRKVTQNEDGTKTVLFDFVQFRDYWI